MPDRAGIAMAMFPMREPLSQRLSTGRGKHERAGRMSSGRVAEAQRARIGLQMTPARWIGPRMIRALSVRWDARPLSRSTQMP